MRTAAETLLIIGFVADLNFQVKIELAAQKLGFRVQWIESASQLGPLDPATPSRQPAEHMYGQGAALIDLLSHRQPALLIIDLGNPDIPWREWVGLIKSAPATRRLPLICYGPHVAGDALRWAKSSGADAVLARSRFTSDLSELIEQYARRPDFAAISAACRSPLSELALGGLELFNHGEYFEAHEVLEAAWNADDTPGRELYRAILQVAVAYLQIERQNYNGAVKMFWRVRQWIDPLPDECRGVDVAGLRVDSRAAYEALIGLGRERIQEFDRRLLRPVRWSNITLEE